jgi:hypothetical protein
MKHRQVSRKRCSTTKSVLRLLDLEHAKSNVPPPEKSHSQESGSLAPEGYFVCAALQSTARLIAFNS